MQDPTFDVASPEAERIGRDLVEQFEAKFSERTTEEWFRDLRANDIPCEPVRFIEELITDEQALANSYVIELKHPAGFTYRTSGPVVQFSNGMPEMRPSPALGEHTAEVFRELGISPS